MTIIMNGCYKRSRHWVNEMTAVDSKMVLYSSAEWFGVRGALNECGPGEASEASLPVPFPLSPCYGDTVPVINLRKIISSIGFQLLELKNSCEELLYLGCSALGKPPAQVSKW